MKIQKNKQIAIITAIILTISMIFLAFNPTLAQTNAVIQTNTYLVVSPDPIGINQAANVMFWLDNTPPQIDSTHYYGWNYSLTITKPDGNTETKGPYESDAVGGCFIVYTPNTIGTYKFQASFLGATINVTSGSMPRGVYIYEEGQSRIVEITVQEEPIEAWPETPLPTGYWSYPITAENREWYQIAGNWIGEGSPAYNTIAPNSAHILWTKELTFGGMTGDDKWGENWYTGLLYENKFRPLIINNRLYYNMWTGPSMFARNVPQGVFCVDMETGEEIWADENMNQISCAQILRFDSGFQAGTLAYLWASVGSNWYMYDAYTGRLLTTFENASGSLSPTYGPNGEILIYSLSGSSNTLSIWNSTKAIIPTEPREGAATYKPWTSSVRDWSDGIQLTTTVPDVPGSQSLQIRDYDSGVLVAQATITGYGLTPTFVHVGYDAKTGNQLWVRNWTNVGWGAGGPTSAGLLTFTKAQGEGCYAFFQKETMQWHVVDIKTGIERWATEPLNTYTETDYSVYDWSGQIAYGKLLVDGYSGDVIAFDLATGEHLWTFTQGSSGLMTPYGSWPSFGGVTVSDNKVYFGVTEHTPNTPMLRGYRLYCIDINSGDLLWEMPGFFTSIAIAGGKLVGYAGYDNQIYCYGKGPSETSVTAAPGMGNAITIQGTVMDQSPGQTAVGLPASKTPAISDDSMDEWMACLYMQQPMPSNAVGVPVTLFVSDQNDNVLATIQATCDIQGHYAASWTPTTNGLYTITAAFDGTNSYYPSTAVTSIAVDKAAPAASPTTQPTQPPITQQPTQQTATPTIQSPSPSEPVPPETQTSNDVYIIGAVATVIIIVAASAALMLRRRK